MASDWEEVYVEDIAAKEASALATGPFGSAISSKYFTDSGVPVIRGSNLSTDVGVRLIDENFVFVSLDKASEFSRSTVYRGDLIFTCWGTINQIGFVHQASKYSKYIISNKQMKLTVDLERVDPKFVYYVFSSPEKQAEILSNGIGAAVPGFNLGQLKRHKLRLPPLDVQRGIIKALDALDSKIDRNRRINQTLEAMAQALFKSWFIDFDPVKAKIAALAASRDPLRAAMSAISGKTEAELDSLPPEPYQQLAATAALFPEEMEESDLGEIPKGWEPGTLSTVCDLNPNSWSARTLPASVKYVDLANTKNGEVIEVQTMEDSNIPSRARRILDAGDTIVGTVRPGNRSFALVGETGLTGSTGFAVLHPKESYLREYVYLVATAEANIERLAHLADGGAYPAVRPELVVADALPIPDKDLLQEFHKITSPMFDQVLEMRRANRNLADLRDTLLPKLLSGELSVEALVEVTGTQ